MGFTVAGNVETFDRSAFTTALARVFPRALSTEVRSVAPASVRVTAAMRYVSRADVESDKLRVEEMSVAQLVAALSLSVESVESPWLRTVGSDASAPSPPTPPTPRSPDPSPPPPPSPPSPPSPAPFPPLGVNVQHLSLNPTGESASTTAIVYIMGAMIAIAVSTVVMCIVIWLRRRHVQKPAVAISSAARKTPYASMHVEDAPPDIVITLGALNDLAPPPLQLTRSEDGEFVRLELEALTRLRREREAMRGMSEEAADKSFWRRVHGGMSRQMSRGTSEGSASQPPTPNTAWLAQAMAERDDLEPALDPSNGEDNITRVRVEKEKERAAAAAASAAAALERVRAMKVHRDA